MNTHNKVIFYSDHACSYIRIVYLPSKSLSLVGAGVSVVDGSSLAAGVQLCSTLRFCTHSYIWNKYS